jgi:hypothetical protein
MVKSTADIPTSGKPTIYGSAVNIPTGITGIPKPGSEAGPVKPSAVKIPGIGPFKERPVMGVIIVVPIVTIPGRVVIISITRKFIFEISACDGSGCIFILVDRCGLLIDHWWWGNIYPGTVEGEANAGIDIDLGLTTGSDQTGSYYCGECKERFHNLSF